MELRTLMVPQRREGWVVVAATFPGSGAQANVWTEGTAKAERRSSTYLVE